MAFVFFFFFFVFSAFLLFLRLFFVRETSCKFLIYLSTIFIMDVIVNSEQQQDELQECGGGGLDETRRKSGGAVVSSSSRDGNGCYFLGNFFTSKMGKTTNVVRQNWRDMRDQFSTREANGSLGDLGTFLPLLLGLSITQGLDLGTTLIFTGVYNVFTGFLFGIPMPLQPMKTIAAVALSEKPLTLNEVIAAGIFVSIIVFIVGASGMIDQFNRVTPVATISGMQLGLGLSLAKKGFTLAAYTSSSMGSLRPWFERDGLFLAITSGLIVLWTSAPKPQSVAAMTTNAKKRSLPRVPAALVLVVLGFILALSVPNATRSLKFGPTKPKLLSLNWEEAKTGIVRAGIPQLPLTMLNSVISVCAVSRELFPNHPAKPRDVATSVGLMNLMSCWFGAMPTCHGAGGLAAHYHFGARTGGAICFLGAWKVLLGILFGSSLLELLANFPESVLGVMLFSASCELMATGLRGSPKQATEASEKFVLLVTASVTVAAKSTWVGFVFGLGTHALLLARAKIEDWLNDRVACGGDDANDINAVEAKVQVATSC